MFSCCTCWNHALQQTIPSPSAPRRFSTGTLQSSRITALVACRARKRIAKVNMTRSTSKKGNSCGCHPRRMASKHGRAQNAACHVSDGSVPTCEFQPSLRSLAPNDKPGVPFSTTSVDMPFGPWSPVLWQEQQMVSNHNRWLTVTCYSRKLVSHHNRCFTVTCHKKKMVSHHNRCFAVTCYK
jgi:hypothetical protein